MNVSVYLPTDESNFELIEEKPENRKIVTFEDESSHEILETKAVDSFVPYENVQHAPEIVHYPVSNFSEEISIGESELLVMPKWSDGKPLQEEKTVIDTWSSVLEDSSPISPNIAFTSKLSPDAPEFTPSYLRQADSDQNLLFLESERNINTTVAGHKQHEKVQKKSKQQKREENLQKVVAEEKHNDKPSKLNVDAAEFKVAADTRDTSTTRGKSYADIVFGDHSHIAESKPSPSVVESQTVAVEKVVDKVVPVESIKPKEENKKKTKKDTRRTEQVVKAIEPEAEEVPEKEPENVEEKLEPTISDLPQTVPDSTPQPMLSWSSIVKKPGEWVDDIVSKTKKAFVESDKKVSSTERKSEKEATKGKHISKERENKPKKTKKHKTKEDLTKRDKLPETPAHTKPDDTDFLESDETDILKENGQSPVTSEDEPQLNVEIAVVPDNDSKTKPEGSVISWASLVSRPGEWIDETVSKQKVPAEPVHKPERAKPSKIKEKKTKTKPKPEKVTKKEESHVEQTVDSNVEEKTENIVEVDQVATVIETEEVTLGTKEPEGPSKVQGFSWAALVKRPGEWVDDIKERKNVEKIPDPVNNETISKSETQARQTKTTKAITKKVKENTRVSKEKNSKSYFPSYNI
uniref:Uncharacterized protein n=1 Tax=Bactrocera latifrons TaxID=174628 RepID=A0A0K8USS8_BACLA